VITSVVVPTRNRRAEIVRLVAGLSAQTASFEAVVAVDGSTDGTAEALAALGVPYELRVVTGPARGRAAACNAAIRAARGEIVLILDDDMEPNPQLVERHASHHPAGSQRCVLGAVPVSDADTSPTARYVARRFVDHAARLSRPRHVFVARDFYTGNTSIRRDVLLEAGSFDERFTAYGNEDVELFLRLRAAGVAFLFDASAVARQHYGKTFAGLIRDTVDKGTTSVVLARAHPEAFGELQLAELTTRFRRWPVVRSALLALTRKRPRLADGLARAAQALERLGAWRARLFYVLALDYFYWRGVERGLDDAPVDGDLAALAAELHRGPIRLLLHR